MTWQLRAAPFTFHMCVSVSAHTCLEFPLTQKLRQLLNMICSGEDPETLKIHKAYAPLGEADDKSIVTK